MIDILRSPDAIRISLQDESAPGDASVCAGPGDGGLAVRLTAFRSRPRFIRLRWNLDIPAGVRILGDSWERAYGNLAWRGLEPDRFLPWYFLLTDGQTTTGIGVRVRPSAMVSWSVDFKGITACLDVRCGGRGVKLAGRTLEVCTVLCENYTLPPYQAAEAFCSAMCPDPLLPEKPVYGGNNWYYAYGKSSREEILADAALQAGLAEGLENRPFMVIDDGWQINPCAGPWVPNERYGDMREIAGAFREMGVRPGIWVRFLRDERPGLPVEWRLNRGRLSPGDPEIHRCSLDPSHPDVLDFIRRDVVKITRDWGFELIKHDFSEFDTFGDWGVNRNEVITGDGWTFFDESRTSAEITKDFYRAILEAAGGRAMILGCNCIGHLLAGYAQINRTGDDTSGVDWSRTRKMGVNALAFRLPQNNRFFAADADCVGIIPGQISWEKNVRWARLLAASGSPLFISCAGSGGGTGSLTPGQFACMRELYRLAASGGVRTVPSDWMDNNIPGRFEIDGKPVDFDWYAGEME